MAKNEINDLTRQYFLDVCECGAVEIRQRGQAMRGGLPVFSVDTQDQAKALQTRLKLTDDQTAKATAIFTAQAAKRDSVMKASNGDRQAMMQAMRPMRQETNAKIEALLTTDEQKAEYKKMQEEMRNRMGGGGQGGGTPPPPTK